MTQRQRIHQALCYFCLGLLTLAVVALYFSNQLVIVASKKTALAEIREATLKPATLPPQASYRAYLTFDDGPSSTTDAVLDVLQKQNVPATFFVIGSTSPESITRYRRIVAEGHTLGLHSYSHHYPLIYRSVQDYIDDTQKLSDFLFEITQVRPTLFRMPGGGFTCPPWMKEEILAHFRAEGYRHYLWNVDPEDAVGQTLSASELTARVIAGAKAKPHQDLIILLHDIPLNAHLTQALPSIIAYLREQGYSLEALPQ